MALSIFLTGDLLRECALSSRTSSFDQGRRLVRRARLVAINTSRHRHGAPTRTSNDECSLTDHRSVRNLSPMVQTLRDDLRRLHRRLAQARVFDNLALHALALVMQSVAQYLKVADEPVDFPDRVRRYALQQRADIVRHSRAVILRLPRQAGDVAAQKFTDLPFHSIHPLQLGGLTREAST